jgi:signal transduction histidine kinase/HPt (histidine-containing phosphotransfer) domain-containing protein
MDLGQAPTDYQHCRILAADDDEKICQLYTQIFQGGMNSPSESERMLEQLLGQEQLEVEQQEVFDSAVVNQGEDAVVRARAALAEGRPYSVAFLDMRMPPGMDGLETAKQLRALDDRIYIVFVTAYSDRSIDELDQTMEHGTLFLRKPFVKEEILQLARTLSRNWSKDRRLEDSVSRAEMEVVNSAMKAKDDFLASMSHELRTPLTAIIGNSEFLAESSLDDDQHELLRSIEVSSLGLLALINDILDLSKIESGKFSVDEIPYDLNEVIDEVGYVFAARAHEAGLKFQVDHPEFTNQLIGDGRRLSQVLINLLSNAMKFTAEGQVTLTVRADEEAGKIHFQVKDQGIGMPQETLSKLFKPFVQADATISGRFGGTGLGLHISWTLVELMGGKIHVESEEGKGSTFCVMLPLTVSELPVSTKRRRCFVTLDCYFSGKILVAEDAPELQSLERRVLKSMGLDVTIANNGREVVELALSEEFDLVLMDMQMPEMDGIEATEMLRSVGYEIPIIALTANVMQQHQDQFEAAGCSGFLAKPIDRHRLQEVLGGFLTSCTREQYLKEGHSIAAAEEKEATSNSFVDDELIQLFTERTQLLRGELISALESENWDEVRAIAHTVKGSGTTFGFPELTRLGKEVCDTVDHNVEDGLHQLTKQLIDMMGEALPNVS